MGQKCLIHTIRISNYEYTKILDRFVNLFIFACCIGTVPIRLWDYSFEVDCSYTPAFHSIAWIWEACTSNIMAEIPENMWLGMPTLFENGIDMSITSATRTWYGCHTLHIFQCIPTNSHSVVLCTQTCRKWVCFVQEHHPLACLAMSMTYYRC